MQRDPVANYPEIGSRQLSWWYHPWHRPDRNRNRVRPPAAAAMRAAHLDPDIVRVAVALGDPHRHWQPGALR
jgi:hypothetical protein